MLNVNTEPFLTEIKTS